MKDIKGYEGLYSISEEGFVFSYPKMKRKSGCLLVPKRDKNGYLEVNLYKNRAGKLHKVHRLVAIAFIPNPENKPEVNHINGIKQDNRVSNLEWATPKENQQHANRTGLIKRNFGAANHSSRPVIQLTTDGRLLQRFCSAREAANSLYIKDQTSIIQACRKNRKTAYGFKWKYA